MDEIFFETKIKQDGTKLFAFSIPLMQHRDGAKGGGKGGRGQGGERSGRGGRQGCNQQQGEQYEHRPRGGGCSLPWLGRHRGADSTD